MNMFRKFDLSDASEENKMILDNINKEKTKTLMLTILMAVLMTIEIILNKFMFVDLNIVILCTFLFSIIINTYVIYKLLRSRVLLSYVLSAIVNNLTIEEWVDTLNNNEIDENKKIVRVKKRAFILEYVMVILCIASCTTAFLTIF